MNYTETKEKSAEILRNVIALMARHEAAYDPINFALWYEHVAGINPRLSQALDGKLQGQAHLTDGDVLSLFKEYIAPVDQQAMERISGQFQAAMAGLAQSAQRTGDDAGKFGEQLNGLAQALKAANVEDLSPHVSQALQNTVGMRDSATALQQQVAIGRQEIEKLHEELNRVRQEALLDPLTRVLNRRGFDQKLADLMGQQPAPGSAHCLIMLDIDHFKQVNDSHGHVTGDRVIQGLGEVLRSTVTTDEYAVARYGGEEFAVLMPHTSVAQGAELAEALRQRTKAMKIRNRKTHDVLLTVTVSAGVASMQPGDDAGRFVGRADSALYQSKQNGRDRVTCV